MAATLRRDRILAEASELFLTHGLGGVTMRGLASRMKVTPMALYRHFGNREELLGAIVAEGHATFLRYLNRALGEDTPARRLLVSGEQYLAFALDHPRSYAVMFMEHVPEGRSKQGAARWGDAATFRFLVDRIRDCVAAGVLRTGDPETVALTIWAHVHGLVSLFLAGKLPLTRAAFAPIYLRSIGTVLGAFGWAAVPEAGC
ncbi:MAG: TetR/AcrR family transcriptional regulator [Deltaproteobacteria bacterium]|nr:TetR/AcrR family transcriptional regulator [Deltaproteobacteria bacterium]